VALIGLLLPGRGLRFVDPAEPDLGSRTSTGPRASVRYDRPDRIILETFGNSRRKSSTIWVFGDFGRLKSPHLPGLKKRKFPENRNAWLGN
jgi:hypothetical protein